MSFRNSRNADGAESHHPSRRQKLPQVSQIPLGPSTFGSGCISANYDIYHPNLCFGIGECNHKRSDGSTFPSACFTVNLNGFAHRRRSRRRFIMSIWAVWLIKPRRAHFTFHLSRPCWRNAILPCVSHFFCLCAIWIGWFRNVGKLEVIAWKCSSFGKVMQQCIFLPNYQL